MTMTTGIPRPPIEPDLLDQAEVARRLNVSRTTIWRLAKRGDIRTVRIGSRTLIPRSELRRIIDSGTKAEE
ncbi:helix-turn-helix domain-containing protein [Nocardioides sp. HB32]